MGDLALLEGSCLGPGEEVAGGVEETASHLAAYQHIDNITPTNKITWICGVGKGEDRGEKG